MLWILGGIGIAGFLLALLEVQVSLVPSIICLVVLSLLMVMFSYFGEVEQTTLKYGTTTGMMKKNFFSYNSLVHLEGDKAYFIKNDAIVSTKSNVPEGYVGPINIQVEIEQDIGIHALLYTILMFKTQPDTVVLTITT